MVKSALIIKELESKFHTYPNIVKYVKHIKLNRSIEMLQLLREVTEEDLKRGAMGFAIKNFKDLERWCKGEVNKPIDRPKSSVRQKPRS